MALPQLGLGLSSNAQTTDVPRPFALLDAHPGLFDFIEYSAPLDVEAARREASLFPELEKRRAQTPMLYHPVHLNLAGPELESAERLKLLAEHVSAVGSPWVSNDVGWWHHQGVPFPGYLYVTPRLDAAGLANAVAHVRHVRDAMPVPLLIENPVVMTARGGMHVVEFMSRLHEATGCPLLIDVGHLVSHQLARGLPLLEGIGALPFAQVAQLHVAGGVVSGKFYADDHPQPIRDETWALFDELIKRASSLCAVTYEGDGHPEAVARRVLGQLRSRILKTNSLSPGRGEGRGEGPAIDWWALFRSIHTEPTEELNFRLAVLAEQLDREVPLARAAVAPTVQQLAPFVSSEHYEAHFTHTKPLADTFLTWAAREARNKPGADALVSLELWARTTCARKKFTEPFEATFPVDLTEALHAVGSLRRHLRARESTSIDAWEGLLHCARRAAAGPWKVRLTPTASGIRIEAVE